MRAGGVHAGVKTVVAARGSSNRGSVHGRVWLATAPSSRNFGFVMSTFRRRLVLSVCGAICGWATLAVAIELPPISGELSGEFEILKTADAPKLRWTAEVRGSHDGSDTRTIDAKIEGDGMRLRADVTLATTQEGRWRINEGTVDLTRWFPVAMKRADGAEGIIATGTVEISGEGLIRGGAASGRVKVAIREARLESAAGGWTLEGVTFAGEFLVEADGFRIKSMTPCELTVAKITTSRFGARNVFLSAVLNDDRTLALREARVEIAGGEVTLAPTMFALSPLVLEATLHVANVGLQDIAALVPAGLSAASGRIGGAVRIGWSAAEGFRLGAGELSLENSEEARARLAPNPGFLTRSMPKRIQPLPTWTGPFARWLSAENPIYTDMERIELGREPLRVEALSIKLMPEGDDHGRTATMRMTARPTRANAAVKSLQLDVNVSGPLDSILTLGLNQNLLIDTH